MEGFGLLAFVLVLLYIGRTSKLERKLRAYERKDRGSDVMLKLISEIVGKKCKITECDSFLDSKIYEVLDADEEWLKLKHTDKKNKTKTKIIRIDSIQSIELVDD